MSHQGSLRLFKKLFVYCRGWGRGLKNQPMNLTSLNKILYNTRKCSGHLIVYARGGGRWALSNARPIVLKRGKCHLQQLHIVHAIEGLALFGWDVTLSRPTILQNVSRRIKLVIYLKYMWLLNVFFLISGPVTMVIYRLFYNIFISTVCIAFI